MSWTGGLILEIVISAKKWFSDEEARYNFYIDVIRAFDKEHWSLCQPEAKDVDSVFEKALLSVHPDLKE